MSHKIKKFNTVWGMVIDVDKCTGCGACMVACQAENNVRITTDASNKLRTTTWLLVYQLTNGEAFPNHDVAYLPRPCQHCGVPSCVSVCPATATDKNEDGGIVSQIYPRCFGCRYCMASCPYHARYFNWYDPHWPEGMDKTLSPDVSVRPRGCVEKCSFCHHRLMAAKDRIRAQGDASPLDPIKLPDGEYITACTETCPNGAISFGNLKDPEHQVYKILWGDQDPEAVSEYLDMGGDGPTAHHGEGHGPLVTRNPNAFRLLEELGTAPQVYYLSRREWVRAQGNHSNMEAAEAHH